MMATRRQLRTQLEHAETERDQAVARARGLEKSLAAADTSRRGSTDRESRMADRIIGLERQLKTVREEHAVELEQARTAKAAEPSDVGALHVELATARRLLAVTQKQLDDATNTGDVGLLTVRPLPADKGRVTAS